MQFPHTDLLAGEFISRLQSRQIGPMWALFPVKQYSDRGLLPAEQNKSWFMVHVAAGSRDFIDLRVYGIWLFACAFVAIMAAAQSRTDVARRFYALALVMAGVPFAASFVMGMGGLWQAMQILAAGSVIVLLAIAVRVLWGSQLGRS